MKAKEKSEAKRLQYNAYHREYEKTNREKINEIKRNSYAKNKETIQSRIRARRAAARIAHPDIANCLQCTKPFVKSQARRKLCSDRCALERKKQRGYQP